LTVSVSPPTSNILVFGLANVLLFLLFPLKVQEILFMNSTSRFVHYIQDLPSLRERLF